MKMLSKNLILYIYKSAIGSVSFAGAEITVWDGGPEFFWPPLRASTSRFAHCRNPDNAMCYLVKILLYSKLLYKMGQGFFEISIINSFVHPPKRSFTIYIVKIFSVSLLLFTM